MTEKVPDWVDGRIKAGDMVFPDFSSQNLAIIEFGRNGLPPPTIYAIGGSPAGDVADFGNKDKAELKHDHNRRYIERKRNR